MLVARLEGTCQTARAKTVAALSSRLPGALTLGRASSSSPTAPHPAGRLRGSASSTAACALPPFHLPLDLPPQLAAVQCPPFATSQHPPWCAESEVGVGGGRGGERGCGRPAQAEWQTRQTTGTQKMSHHHHQHHHHHHQPRATSSAHLPTSSLPLSSNSARSAITSSPPASDSNSSRGVAPPPPPLAPAASSAHCC